MNNQSAAQLPQWLALVLRIFLWIFFEPADQALNEEQAISTGKDLYLFSSVSVSFSLAIRVPVQAVALAGVRGGEGGKLSQHLLTNGWPETVGWLALILIGEILWMAPYPQETRPYSPFDTA